MGNSIRYLVWLLTCLLVPLRYRIHVDGGNTLQDLKGPVLLLPNHPAFVDPALIFATFYRVLRPRTVLYEGNFPGPVRAILVKLLRAVCIPDLQRPNAEAHQQTEQAVADVIAGLRRGESFILWPSGRIQRDGVERLGAARGLTEILREVPEANIVLVKTQGLWGSMFSFARTGRMPRLARCLANAVLLLASNLFVFMPRRRVDITVELVDRSALPELNWNEVNHWFEARYNSGGPEQPKYVPYHRLFGPWHYHFPSSSRIANADIQSDQIRPETSLAVANLLTVQLGRSVNLDEIDPGTKLDDLGLDSLRRMDLALAVEQLFAVSANSVPETLGQLLTLAEGLAELDLPKPPAEWSRPPSNVEPLRILGETIPQAFIARALANPRDIAAADDYSGVVTYERLLIGAVIMARRFSRLPGANIGLMLPASVASDMMLMGLYLASKLPVLLNWTTGPGNLRHAVQLTSLTYVISSRQLRVRLGIKIEGVRFLDVEDLQSQIGWFEKLRWFATVRFLPGSIRRHTPQLQPSTHAVILFTSGSEKAPKAVPLTHRNIVSNLETVPTILDLTNADAVLGFLPMFHSFGFTMTGVFPLLANIRVVHHGDPTDVAGLTRKITAYAPTVLVGMPSLISRLVERAQPSQLESLRLVVVGAEACPSSLYNAVQRKAPKAHLLEGYGITECSPAIAANRPYASRPGTVGQPLPGVEVCVVDLETGEEVSPETMGMLLVRGPGVFEGYLGDEASPFVDRHGVRWFVTGDLVTIDADAFIHFRGRLKRFVKSGGEMISLPALEEPFALRYPPDKTGPRVAVEGIETESGRKIVLFTTEPICLEDANSMLAESGFRGVMHLDEVRRIREIPLMGTGKIDYRRLQSIIRENKELYV